MVDYIFNHCMSILLPAIKLNAGFNFPQRIQYEYEIKTDMQNSSFSFKFFVIKNAEGGCYVH